MRNFVKDGQPLYRKPDPLKKGWHYIGDGKPHDPTTGHPEMRGRTWMIDPSYHSGKSFEKFQQGLKND
jgi:hypothetical protein